MPRLFTIIAVLLAVLPTLIRPLQAQDVAPELREIRGPNLWSKAPIYESREGRRYSTFVVVKFNRRVVETAAGVENVFISDIRPAYGRVQHALSSLQNRFGQFKVVKVYPHARWGETMDRHVATGAPVQLSERSQIFEIHFEDIVPLDEVIEALSSLEEVEFAEPPTIYHFLVESANAANPVYESANVEQWNLNKVEASKAWNISQGNVNAPVIIGISDDFSERLYREGEVLPYANLAPSTTDYGEEAIHPDLRIDPIDGGRRLDVRPYCVPFGGCIAHYGGHGVMVSGVAGAISGNGEGINSLGWSLKMKGDATGRDGFKRLACLGQGPDCVPARVINMSWFNSCLPGSIEYEVRDALIKGIILIAGAGNSLQSLVKDKLPGCVAAVPTPVYPAAYNFPDLNARVIAVSATTEADNFVTSWNHSTGDDPIGDPANAFIDLAAPGYSVPVLYSRVDTLDGLTHGLMNASGTSFAAPLVSSLVTLMLSINDNLTPAQVYEALTVTADRVGQYSYVTQSNGLPWNRYMGYGRVNAFEALKYVIEHFGGTLGGVGQVVTINESLTIQPGATLSVRPGTTIRMGPNVSLTSYGTLSWIGTAQNPIVVERRAQASKWREIELRADGNTFVHVVLDGGISNLTVRSRSNTLRYFTSRNAASMGLGVRSRYEGGGRGRVNVYHSTIEGSANYGVYAYNGDVYLSNTTVQNNGLHGVYGYHADVYVPGSRIIRNGGGTSSSTGGGHGVYLTYSASLYASSFAVASISGNDGHEVNVGGSNARGYLANGYNLICDGSGYGASKRYLRNAGNARIDATMNWWGTPSPVAAMFEGDINYTPTNSYPLITPYCASSGGSGALMASTTAEPTLFADVLVSDADSGPVGQTGSHGAPRQPGEDWTPVPDNLRERIVAARQALVERSSTSQAAALMAELYRLHRWDIHGSLGEASASMDVINVLRRLPARRSSPAGAGVELVERAALIAIDDALYVWDSDRARALLEEHKYDIISRTGRAEYASALVELLRREGRGEEALVALDNARSLLDPEYVLAIEAELLTESIVPIGSLQPSSTGVIGAEGNMALQAEVAAYDTDLLPPFPNPSSGYVTVPITVTARADVRVSVYDALGREVAVLVNTSFGPGKHSLHLNGSSLPSGVYALRARIDAAEMEPKMFVRMISIVH